MGGGGMGSVLPPPAGPRSPRVTVGLVTWNSATDLPSCIDGLAHQTFPSIDVVVVDNASADSSVDIVRERLPGARIVRNERNEGYSRAHNQAIAASSGEFYLALNPDVTLLPEFVARLADALVDRPRCGMASGKLWQCGEEMPRTLDAAGLFVDRKRHQYLRGHGDLDRGQYDQAQEVFGVDGAAGFYRRAMLEDVNLDGEYFDELFFTYMEDVDLAWRARLLGWRCWYEPRSVAIHRRTFQPGRRSGMHRGVRATAVKNRYLMMLKNEGREEWRRDWWRIGLYDLGIWAYVLLVERSSLGALPVLKQQWGMAAARRRSIWGRVRADPSERLTWFR
jgi:GT2 family glycosyltransferase